MGRTIRAALSYGLRFEEDCEFPWDAKKFDGDIEAWWRSVNGYVNPRPCPFTDTGDYKPGITRESPDIDVYFAFQRDWSMDHPVPVDLENYATGDDPAYLVVVPGLGDSCYCGDAESIDPTALVATDDHGTMLLKFCQKHGIETDQEPQWWLTSYYG